MAKIPGVIKGRFYVTTSLSDSWEGFTPSRASWSYPREIFILVSSTFLYSQIYGDHYIWPGRFYTSWRNYPRKIFQYLQRALYVGRLYTNWSSYSRKAFPYKCMLTPCEPLSLTYYRISLVILYQYDRQIIIIAKIQLQL